MSQASRVVFLFSLWTVYQLKAAPHRCDLRPHGSLALRAGCLGGSDPPMTPPTISPTSTPITSRDHPIPRLLENIAAIIVAQDQFSFEPPHVCVIHQHVYFFISQDQQFGGSLDMIHPESC